MPSFISIQKKRKFLNGFFRFLSGDRYFEQFEDNKYLVKYYWNHIIINCVNLLFFLLFILSAIAFFWIAAHGIYFDIIKNNGSFTAIIKGIELIFISPLPLLITTAFHNYYKNIIMPIVYYKMFGAANNDDLLKNDSYEINKISSLVDMGIIKYLFTSIFISTIFVFMIGRMLKISGEDGESTEINNYKISFIESKTDTAVRLTFQADSLTHHHMISEAQLSKMAHLHQEDMFTNIRFDLFGLLIAVVSIVLLMIYLRIIGKNLNEDIESSIKYGTLPEKDKTADLVKTLEQEGLK